MEELLNAADIAARYKCSLHTARSRMRQMEHMENPLLVSESAIMKWEQSKTYRPVANVPSHHIIKSAMISSIPKRKD